MSIRHIASKWMRSKGYGPDGPYSASKLYSPEESWTGGLAWWFEIPKESLKKSSKYIHLLCEADLRSTYFYVLRIPTSFLLKKEDGLGFREKTDKFSLFISAEPTTRFIEQRGAVKLDLSEFEVTP